MSESTYALWQRKDHVELSHVLEGGLTLDQMIDAVKRIVDGHGVAALKRYAVLLNGGKEAWTGQQWWDLMVEVPRDNLVKVSAEVVISELIRDQMDNNRPSNEVGRDAALVMQQTLRAHIALIRSLGFEVARKVASNGE